MPSINTLTKRDDLKNYIKYPIADNDSIVGWNRFADAPVSLPEDGISGIPDITFSRTTDFSLRNIGEITFSKPSSNCQGQGVSYDFSIEPQDRNKELVFKFPYRTDLNYVEGSVSLHIYSVDTSAMLSVEKNELSSSNGEEVFEIRFKTLSNSLNYRVIIFVNSDTTTAFDISFSDFFIGTKEVGGSIDVDEFIYSDVLAITGGSSIDDLDARKFSIVKIENGGDLTGIVPSKYGNKQITILNVSTTADLILKHQSSLSVSTNRLTLAKDKDIKIKPRNSITLFYDLSATSWRVLGGGVGGGGGTNGLIYSPSKTNTELLDGEYNSFPLLIADIQELPIKNIYFSEVAVLDILDFKFNNTYNLERYNLIGLGEQKIITIYNEDNEITSVNNGGFFQTVENLFLRISGDLYSDLNQKINLIDTHLRFYQGEFVNFTLSLQQTLEINLKNSRITKNNTFTGEIIVGAVEIYINSHYGSCHIDDEVFYGIISLTHNEYGAFDYVANREYTIIGSQPSGSALIPTQNNYKTVDQIVGAGMGGGGASITFTSTTDFALGSPVYFDGTNWQLASANNEATSVQYVISAKSGSGTFTYTALSSGEIELTDIQWQVVTGVSGGLEVGATYYLSNLSGLIQTTPSFLYAPVLRALSSTKAFVSLSINNTESGMGETFTRETFVIDALTQNSITLSHPPSGKSYVWMSIDGVSQNSNAFDLAGQVISFTSSVDIDSVVDVTYARSILLADVGAINRFVSFAETVSGSPKSSFNIPTVPSGVQSCIVFVGGSVQDDSKFNLVGNVLTFVEPIAVGVQVIVWSLNASGVTQIDSFVTRTQWTLPIDGTITLGEIFGSAVTGVYRFFDKDDPRIKGELLYKHDDIDPDVRIDTNSSNISITLDTADSLNVYLVGNALTFQNKLSVESTIVVYREI